MKNSHTNAQPGQLLTSQKKPIPLLNLFLKRAGLALLLVLIASVAAWSDTMNGVTSSAAQAANDSVAWSQLGANGTLLAASFNATSAKSIAVTGSFAGANSILAVACAATPCSWKGTGFTAADTLVWTSDVANGGNGPLTLNFGSNVSGAGAMIQADGPGQFTAQVQAFNGATPLGSFSVTSNANGDATYIGIVDQTGTNITSVTISLTSCAGACTDFAIDTLNLNSSSTSSFTLSLTTAGTGAGTVTSSPAGISCPGTCSASFSSGTVVTLTAAAASGSTFAGWSGGCTGTGACSVTMSAANAVTATFNTNAVTFALTASLAGTGTGSVTSSPTGISCPGTCANNFNSGTVVTLTAAAGSGSTFAGWTGACIGTGACSVTMNAAQSVTATFNTATFPLTVSLAGTGAGSVSSSPAGISCPGTCAASFNSGSVVTLSAAGASGSTFAGWSGACTGTGTCSVTMSAAKSVTATFNTSVTTFALAVSKSGTGTGTVTSSPAGINCGATCSANFKSGTIVTLTAKASSGSKFAGWSGPCTGTSTCKVTMTAAQSVAATFNIGTYTLKVTHGGTGKGTVTSSPAGINCTVTCSATFNNGTVVTLTATAATGSAFTGWSGACTGTGACTVTMTASKSVTATFKPLLALTVKKTGTGTGTVTSNPAGINCGSTCSATYVQGTLVALTATPDAGHAFGGWSGACTGTAGCSVTMSAAKSVTAKFN